jgi:hypothetical protein
MSIKCVVFTSVVNIAKFGHISGVIYICHINVARLSLCGCSVSHIACLNCNTRLYTLFRYSIFSCAESATFKALSRLWYFM